MNLFLRYAAMTDFLPNPFFTTGCDSRILFILAGTGAVEFDGKAFPLKENTLVYYPLGTAYYPHADGNEPLQFITLNFDFTQKYAYMVTPFSPVKTEIFDKSTLVGSKEDIPFEAFREPFVLTNAFSLRERFIELALVFEEKLPYFREQAGTLLENILYQIMAQNDGLPGSKEKILLFLQKNFAVVNSNAAIAAQLNYHPNYINRIVKSATGCSLHAYINQLRLKHAADLLTETALSVERIAEACGYISTKHFSALFLKQYGITPSGYRKRGRWV